MVAAFAGPMLRFEAPMSLPNSNKPRVGIPWRTSDEERQGVREKLDNYFEAVRRAGGGPAGIFLSPPAGKLAGQIERLGGVVFARGPSGGQTRRRRGTPHRETTTVGPA